MSGLSSNPLHAPDARKCYPIDQKSAIAGWTSEMQCPLAERYPIDDATYNWYVEDRSTGHHHPLELRPEAGSRIEALNDRKDTIWLRNVSKSDDRLIYICEKHTSGGIRHGWKVQLNVKGEIG